MKKLLLLMILSASLGTYGQINETFSDGNISDDPVWYGDTSRFEVNESQQLRLQSEGTDTTFIITPSQLVENGEWDFWVKLSFNTSANNYTRIYLASTQSNLLDPQMNGYYLQIGGSNDSLVFCRQSGTQSTVIFTGTATCTNHSSNILRIKMIHDENGIWHLLTDLSGGNNFSEEGTGFDNTFTSSSYFGLFCRYTSSNSTKFYFDDIYAGPVIRDTIPPEVVKIKVKDSVTLEVFMSEQTDTSNLHVGLFQTLMHGDPQFVYTDPLDPAIIILRFQNEFENEVSDTLITGNIPDLAGNVSQEEKTLFFLHSVKAYEVVINEIMADPDPPAGLPVSEYLELFNRSAYPADLNGWTLVFGASKKPFPELVIPPGGFLIVTKGSFMDPFGPTVDLFTSSSSLSNDGTTIILKNQDGHVIHTVEYSSDWYNNPVKEEGGWALEMVDVTNPCGCADNWKASADISGGTPGRINSVSGNHRDTISPHIKGIRLMNDSLIRVIFSESMDSATGNYGDLNGDRISGRWSAPEFAELEFFMSEPIIKGLIHELKLTDSLTDCAGNRIINQEVVKFAVPDSMLPNDIVINEILPDPYSDGKRFVELYNRSFKILDLKELVFCAFDSISYSFKDIKEISVESQLFLPGGYLILTNDPLDIKNRYTCPDPDVFIPLTSMPSMTNDYGDLVIARKHDGTIIDRVRYQKNMFFSLINDVSGISLERISPDGSSEDPLNWHSASFTCGYATPGYCNSEFQAKSDQENDVNISPKIFSPDNDGRDDILTITIHSKEVSSIRIIIYNKDGRFVRNLVKSQLTDGNENFFWDGLDENHSVVSAGIFLLYLEMITNSGEIVQKKIPVVVARKN